MGPSFSFSFLTANKSPQFEFFGFYSIWLHIFPFFPSNSLYPLFLHFYYKRKKDVNVIKRNSVTKLAVKRAEQMGQMGSQQNRGAKNSITTVVLPSALCKQALPRVPLLAKARGCLVMSLWRGFREEPWLTDGKNIPLFWRICLFTFTKRGIRSIWSQYVNTYIGNWNFIIEDSSI